MEIEHSEEERDELCDDRQILRKRLWDTEFRKRKEFFETAGIDEVVSKVREYFNKQLKSFYPELKIHKLQLIDYEDGKVVNKTIVDEATEDDFAFSNHFGEKSYLGELRKHFLDIISKVNRLAQKLDLKVWSPFNLYYTLVVYSANFTSGKKQDCIKAFLGIGDKTFCKMPIDSYNDLMIVLEHLKYLNIVPKLQYIMTEDLELNEYGSNLLKECNINISTCPKNTGDMSHVSLISNLNLVLGWDKRFFDSNNFIFQSRTTKFAVNLMSNEYQRCTKFYHDSINNKIAVKVKLHQTKHYLRHDDIYFIVVIDNDFEKDKIDLSDDIFDPTNYIECEEHNRIQLNLPEFEITNFVDHIENPELAKLAEFNDENRMVEDSFGSSTESIAQDSTIKLNNEGITFADKVLTYETISHGGMPNTRSSKIVRVKDKETIVSCVKPFRWLLTNNNLIFASGYVDGTELEKIKIDKIEEKYYSQIETLPIIVTEKIIKKYVQCYNMDKEYIPRIIFKEEFDGKFSSELKNKSVDELKPLILKYDPECDDDDIKFYYDDFIARVQFENCRW
uniref:Uncharacterized protein n=1 Tax=viral metagenome TaxID=1070528 RepID=A0A6C0EB97_9ZZZZ